MITITHKTALIDDYNYPISDTEAEGVLLPKQ